MWVRSSFEEGLTPVAGPLRPTRAPAARGSGMPKHGGLWAEQHAPRATEQLAVHRGKVEEVERWLLSAQQGFASQATMSPFLLLTGPAGAGKSACLRCVAARLRLQVLEWVCPASARYRGDDVFRADEPWEGPGDTVTPEGQLRRFADFLLRANRYSSVLSSAESDGRLVLLDELPNALVFRREEFYDILRRYGRSARSPCVFVLSDGGGGRSDLSPISVFPDRVQRELGMHQITFRPVANKQLVMAMERVLAAETTTAGSAAHPGRAVLEELAAASSGDVRAAINALQFLSENKTAEGAPKKRARGLAAGGRGAHKRLKQAEAVAVGSRDASLGLFRALGKIIYAKRGTGAEPPLPTALSAQRRAPLLEQQPEQVVARAGVQPATLVAHLHHNYADFCPRLEEAVVTVDHLSHADLLTADWQLRSSTLAYGGSVAARGVMFSRPQSVSVGFRQFSQPRLSSVEEQYQRRREELQRTLADWRLSGEALVCDLLPYLHRRTPGYRPAVKQPVAAASCCMRYTSSSCRYKIDAVLGSGACSDDEVMSDSINIEEYGD